MKTFKEVETQYKQSQKEHKERIKQEPRKLVRFFKWCLFYIIFPWKWLFVNIRDFKTFIIFFCTLIVVYSPIWVCYMLSGILDNNALFVTATSLTAFYVNPATPFLLLCVCITIAIKGVLNKRKDKTNEP